MIEAVFAGLPVADFDAAIDFYERFFGRPADLVPKEGDSAWQLAGPGWVCERWIGARAPGAVGVAEGGAEGGQPREPMPPLLPLPGRASTTGAARTRDAAAAVREL